MTFPNDRLISLLVDPETNDPLRVEADGNSSFLSAGVDRRYPFADGIASFVETESFAESFGDQWNRFNVRQVGEDEATFEAKTGIAIDDLSGKLVLDAGCGGGRYASIVATNRADIVGVDRSNAVRKARQLCGDRSNVLLMQADLTRLPLRDAVFDLVFSIGVLHHGPDPRASFDAIAKLVKPGGRLSVWLYRKCSLLQEFINHCLRFATVRFPRPVLLPFCWVGAVLGAIPIVNRTLNQLVPFSNHPAWENRVCDTFDWYSPKYQYHYTPSEIREWFEDLGFVDIEELPPEKGGKLYRWAWKRGMIMGSGVNFTGLKKL